MLNELQRRFYVNNVYRTKYTAIVANQPFGDKLVVFVGLQDIKGYGFFRELNNPNTFFGLKLSDITFIY